MSVSAANNPIKTKGRDECLQIGLAVRRIGAQELDDIEGARAALVLVFLSRHDAARLTGVLLVHANNVIANLLPIITLDHNRNFVLKTHDARLRCRQAKTARKHEADMLVL